MSLDSIMESIEVIDSPIDFIGRPIDFLNRKRHLLIRLRRFSQRRYSKIYLNRVFYLSYLLSVISLVLFICGSVEHLQGDKSIIVKVPNGAICNDGWRTYSQGPGTCSWHNGVDYYLFRDISVGTNYANPEPYFFLSAIFFATLLICCFLNRNFKIVIFEIGILMTTGFYFIFFISLSLPLVILRGSLHLIALLPVFALMLFYLIFNRKK